MIIPKTAIVIAGASGDLAQRKLIPALDTLFSKNQLGPEPTVIGTGRTPFSVTEFRKRFDVTAPFAQRLFYHQHIDGLKNFIADFGVFERVIFFLSLPPSAYAETAGKISAEGFSREAAIIIEKPFGYDSQSARELNRQLAPYFDESQIFRIDHYLAKEAVQNILVFRFANSLFYPVWNSRYVESIQINALEETLIDPHRCGYFDRAGIIRDMVQNHLLQLLCLLTIEAPLTLSAEDISSKKIEILRSLRIDACHRFQYEGYCTKKGVNPASTTETFAELQCSINNFRWTGMPIYIRTGKALHRRGTEIGIRFKTLPQLLFNKNSTLPPNQIIFKIQPAEGIILDIESKIPGTDADISRSTMNFCYRDSFKKGIPEAYQRLLYDVLRNDHTLFVSARESECAWNVVDPVLDRTDLTRYTPGALPRTALPVDWIDFDQYQGLCS